MNQLATSLPHVEHQGTGGVAESLVKATKTFFSSLRTGVSAALDYQDLDAMSDAELKQLGLDRQQLPRHVIGLQD